MTDPSDQDLKALWKGQETETDPMTLEQIHALTRKYDRKMRIGLWVLPFGLVATGVLGAQAWMTRPDPLGRLGAVLYLLGMMASFALIARVAFAWRDPAEPAGAYLRRRLERQLANLKGGWVLAMLPIVPGMVVIYLWILEHNHGPAWQPWPPLVVMAAVVGFVMIRARRGARRIKADLEELDRLMRG